MDDEFLVYELEKGGVTGRSLAFDHRVVQADRLREVGGIGPARAARIVAAWAEQKAVREIMVFLRPRAPSGN